MSFRFERTARSLSDMTSRRLLFAALMSVVLASCGGGDASDAPLATASVAPSTGSPSATSEAADDGAAGAAVTAPEEAAAAGSTERPAPDPSREMAPDFTLTLADGSDFTLSNELRPVFMIFWAEW